MQPWKGNKMTRTLQPVQRQHSSYSVVSVRRVGSPSRGSEGQEDGHVADRSRRRVCTVCRRAANGGRTARLVALADRGLDCSSGRSGIGILQRRGLRVSRLTWDRRPSASFPTEYRVLCTLYRQSSTRTPDRPPDYRSMYPVCRQCLTIEWLEDPS